MYDTIIDQIQDHQELLAPTPPPPVVSDGEEFEEEESASNDPPPLPTPPPQQIIDAQIISVEVQRHHVVTVEEQQLEDLAFEEEIPDVPSELPPSPKIVAAAVEETVNIAPQAEDPTHEEEEEKEMVEMEVKPENTLEAENDNTKIQNDDDDDYLGEIPPPDYEEEVLKNPIIEEVSEIPTEEVLENISLEEPVLDNTGIKEELEDSLEFSDENGNNTEPEEPIAEIKQPPILLPPMEVRLETRVA